METPAMTARVKGSRTLSIGLSLFEEHCRDALWRPTVGHRQPQGHAVKCLLASLPCKYGMMNPAPSLIQSRSTSVRLWGQFRERFETEMIEKNDAHFYVGSLHQFPN